jgi:hypothetical protein
MSAMLPALVDDADAPALDVFLVESLPFGVAGLSLGTPGPPLPGSYYHGVVLERPANDAAMARVLAHEVSHFLALQHVENRSLWGEVFPDPLDDTDPSQDNLMEDGTAITPDQAFALSRSALLRPDSASSGSSLPEHACRVGDLARVGAADRREHLARPVAHRDEVLGLARAIGQEATELEPIRIAMPRRDDIGKRLPDDDIEQRIRGCSNPRHHAEVTVVVVAQGVQEYIARVDVGLGPARERALADHERVGRRRHGDGVGASGRSEDGGAYRDRRTRDL